MGLPFSRIPGYLCLHSLLTHDEHQTPEERLLLSLQSILLLHCLLTMEYLTPIGPSEPLSTPSLSMAVLLYRYLAAVRYSPPSPGITPPSRYNGHQVDWSLPSPLPGQADCLPVASGLYLPLLNHSCDSNTVRLFVGSTMVLLASRSIARGEEVTDSYGMTFLETKKTTRQKSFATKYKFDCECEACTRDFPTIKELNTGLPPNLLTVYSKGMQEVSGPIVAGGTI